MKHEFIDRYSGLDSVLHRLDPRVKLILALLFLVLISTTRHMAVLPLYAVVIAALMAVSRVPLVFYLKKWLVVTPLALMISLFMALSAVLEGGTPPYTAMALVVVRIYLSILVITVLVSCTPFTSLLWGMRKFRLPAILTTLSKMVYTYAFLMVDELHRSIRAYRSRTPKRRVSRFKVYGYLAAGIFLRSIERSDRIYQAMVSRGFTGEFPEGNVHRLKTVDLAAVLMFITVTAGSLLLQGI